MNSTLWHPETFTDKRQGDRRGYAGQFKAKNSGFKRCSTNEERDSREAQRTSEPLELVLRETA